MLQKFVTTQYRKLVIRKNYTPAKTICHTVANNAIATAIPQMSRY